MARRTGNRPQVPFSYKLVLNQWLLSLFNVRRFEELAEHLRNEALEGLDENNIHHFHHALTAQLFNLTRLPTDLLLEFDQNIVRHTQRLNERRITRGDEPIVWKYFQYLTLLFSEIYLDHYFRDPKALLAALNAQVAAYNADKAEADQIAAFDESAEVWPQLNKLAFWMATGSGKTLLMHANILQYQHALTRHGRHRELNRILLLTPNEGLSQQHLREFEAAGIDAELFNKDGRGLFSGQAVEIIEVTRLRDEMGDRTIAIDAFEGNNLVLVDEGHRGASGGEEGAWMRARNALCEKGFSFEYSATFGQAVKGSPRLTELYAKSTLCDYSYRYFYGDGFGKDYQILNLDEGTQQNHLKLYLVACLLSFFQQQRLYRVQGGGFQPFNVEKPLWIFVGGRVTATLAKKDASDIVEILQFLARYAADRADSIQCIDRVLNEGLVTATGKDLFAGRFAYLNTRGLSPAQVFDETLVMIFNAPGGGQLYVENLKGAAGEVALRLGAENEPFGVINVGDDAKLVKLCGEHGLATGEREFSGSLFHEINQSHSTVHLLIGSKKFYRGLEQLARIDDGPDERRQGGRRADHPTLRARRTAQGLRPESQAQRQDKAPRRRRATETPSACSRRSASSASMPTTWRSSVIFSRKRGYPPTMTASSSCCRSSRTSGRRNSRRSVSRRRSTASAPSSATRSASSRPSRPSRRRPRSVIRAPPTSRTTKCCSTGIRRSRR